MLSQSLFSSFQKLLLNPGFNKTVTGIITQLWVNFSDAFVPLSLWRDSSKLPHKCHITSYLHIYLFEVPYSWASNQYVCLLRPLGPTNLVHHEAWVHTIYSTVILLSTYASHSSKPSVQAPVLMNIWFSWTGKILTRNKYINI